MLFASWNGNSSGIIVAAIAPHSSGFNFLENSNVFRAMEREILVNSTNSHSRHGSLAISVFGCRNACRHLSDDGLQPWLIRPFSGDCTILAGTQNSHFHCGSIVNCAIPAFGWHSKLHFYSGSIVNCAFPALGWRSKFAFSLCFSGLVPQKGPGDVHCRQNKATSWTTNVEQLQCAKNKPSSAH